MGKNLESEKDASSEVIVEQVENILDEKLDDLDPDEQRDVLETLISEFKRRLRELAEDEDVT